MRILALEPYYGGSHRAFLGGWIARSRHSWRLLALPASKWKWRMRHSAITFSREAALHWRDGDRWDAVFCSDMLNLAEFTGLVPPHARVPAVAYFHENQITYPVVHEKDYDYHFAFTNMTTALAAERVWFNSRFHCSSFLDALDGFLRRMPDNHPIEAVDRIRRKCSVRPPAVDVFPRRGKRDGGPLHILWAARWEYDKGPDRFFEALEILTGMRVPFRLSVIGGWSGPQTVPVFERARKRFEPRIVHWGYQESRAQYAAVLAQADVAVSTADHEFFGIGILEAMAAGACPLVPRRLAYPEVVGDPDDPAYAGFFYDGSARDLAARLGAAAERISNADVWRRDRDRAGQRAAMFSWERSVPEWDNKMEQIAGAGAGGSG